MPPELNTYKGQIHPPFTERITQMKKAGLGAQLKDFFITLLIAGAVGGICFLIGYSQDLTWLKWTGIILGVVIMIISFSIKLKAAQCPYCDKKLTIVRGKSLGEDAYLVECDHCLEMLVEENDQLRALKDKDAEALESFQAPVFLQGQWPQECLCCGRPISKYEKIDSRKFNAGALLVGTVSMSSATIPNIPYCDAHSDAVKAKIVNDHPKIVFPDYAMFRRYLAINKGKKPLKIKG